MQTFTRKELEYLEKLMTRNIQNEFRNKTEPLKKPMDVEERKLRSRIREKCKIYIYELALAEFCGVIPDKEMKKANMNNIYEALDKASWYLTLKAVEENLKHKQNVK
ncbi:MAG: hypothetical protein QXF82_03570 [Nitrososphaeria archaeon]